MTSTRFPALAVVVVTYNSADMIGGLLDSLPAGLEGVEGVEVVIADNASSDDSVALAEAHPVGPRVIRTGRNGGYAAGINAALQSVSPDAHALILNPDIRLRPGAALRLVERFRDQTTGIAVPRIEDEDGNLIPSLRREPSVVTAWSDALLGKRLSQRLDIGEVVYDPAQYRSSGSVHWASGAALALSNTARRMVGAWDESFFLYSEEVDYQRRVRAQGLGIVFVPDAEVVHIGGDYLRSPRLYAMLTANRIRDYGRHHGAAATALFRLGVVCGETLRSASGSVVHRAGLRAGLRPTPSLGR